MARDISKPQPEEAAPGVNFENVGSICQSFEEEAGSSASRGRKSFSFITGRVFFKRVLGYNDKDRSLESEGEPIHNARKSVSNSKEMGYETSFKEPEPDIDQEAKYVNKVDHSISHGRNVKTVELQDMAEDGNIMEIIAERNSSEEAAVNNEVMGEAVSNEKEGAREDSMLYSLESPSFRVYCVHNVSVDGDGKDENGDKDIENKSLKETVQKGSENQAVKRRRRSRFRTPLRNGGPARTKNLMFASCSCTNTTQESVCGSAGNAVPADCKIPMGDCTIFPLR
ncbi:hypothetical protein SADUNF_Sadunf17G0060100 [Salix dunnii]|uniref:Uncharacterized protein n=1 Tax=Salix dunnii TaxID=1413687 RepID=A0A835J5N2_9ROSI|nr:hypothetical protein SADUNF_Sadunf17G0060100 [Salix dunnii]